MNLKNDEDMYFDYLNSLRDSGIVNMLGAVPYLINEFLNLTEEEAKEILINWIKSF